MESTQDRIYLFKGVPPDDLKVGEQNMEVTSPHCAGLDVHKKTVVVCCLTIDSKGELGREVRTFSTSECRFTEVK
ncbi:MAG: hypothetical protein JO235_00670 [Chroococcidiopsidaceae cyanobacterium CP_BM_RX_35]|nr:hypothetical protein [Chroococcidiopsidaceae cyanobacterium CP_BM_RX_35]